MSPVVKNLYLLTLTVFVIITLAEGCDQNGDCGWKAVCSNGTVCSCPVGLSLHSDGKNCMNSSCVKDDCLECLSLPTSCSKCLSFMSSTTGQCLTKCEGSAEMKGNNLVCTESGSDGDVDIVVAIVAGVGAGMLLCVLVILGVCLYLRRSRKNVNLQRHDYRDSQMEIGRVKRFPGYENNAFEADNHIDYRSGKIDPLHYVNELDNLRPHTDTLLTLLTQVKAKARAMNSSDPRVSTYKGMIHQLCRVMALLHKKDPVVSIPGDALSLLNWAQQMLDDHREQQSSSGVAREYPIARISAVDGDFETPTSPVYASPNDNSFSQIGSSPSTLATPYSTVPVPLPSSADDQSRRRKSSRNSGYATIRRTPSLPNGELINSVENSSPQFYAVGAEPVNVSSFSSAQKGLGVLKKEDFQTFIISNGRTSSDEYSTIDKKNNDNGNIGVKRLSRQEPPPEIFNSSSEHSYGDIDFSGGNVSPARTATAQKEAVNTARIDDNSPVVLRNKKKTISPVSRIESTPPIKKNIITNPNAIKKSPVSDSKARACAKPTPNVGYFANGHFYDPNWSSSSPPQPETEVYAPGSSVSERSNVMSTFLGDLPLSRTPSQSDNSEDGNDESDNSGGELDVFPFDPKEATNPVEV